MSRKHALRPINPRFAFPVQEIRSAAIFYFLRAREISVSRGKEPAQDNNILYLYFSWVYSILVRSPQEAGQFQALHAEIQNMKEMAGK